MVGKDQRSNKKLNCFSNPKCQIHPLKKYLERVDDHYQKLVIRNEFSKLFSITKVLLAFPFLVPSISFHHCSAKELWGLGFLIWLSWKRIPKLSFIQEPATRLIWWSMWRIVESTQYSWQLWEGPPQALLHCASSGWVSWTWWLKES